MEKPIISLETALKTIEGLMPGPDLESGRLAMKLGFIAGLMLAPESPEVREALRAEAQKELNKIHASIGAEPNDISMEALRTADWTK